MALVALPHPLALLVDEKKLITPEWFNKFQDLRSQIETRLAAAETSITGITTDITGLETDIAALDTRIDTLEAVTHFGYAVVTLSANTTLDATYKNKLVWVDCTAASRTITLPSAASFGVGLIGFKKIDTTSQALIIAGTLEQSQSSFAMSLEGDAGIFASDGSIWKLIAPGLATFRKNPFVAEHTVTTVTYNATREYNGCSKRPSLSSRRNFPSSIRVATQTAVIALDRPQI